MPAKARPHRDMSRSYADEVKLFRSRASKIWIAVLVLLWAAFPMFVSDFWLSVMCYAGIAAIGAVGLNLLIGYTGQVSLGHAFFLGCGAYLAAEVGGDIGLPIYVWLPGAFLIGAAIGALIGPFALRLRGNYLAIITLGLVFIGDHVFRNLRGITGGNGGTSVLASPDFGFIDFSELTLLGTTYSRNQGYFWFIWMLVALVALLTTNMVRSRPGRALQAIRDRDIAAEVIGIPLGRYKVAAFAISSGFAAVAGAMFGSFQEFVSPEEFGLFLSISYLAYIIVGGVGTVFGSVLGALFVGGVPAIIDEYADSIPFVQTGAGDSGFISVSSLQVAIFGLLIVLFLIFEPRGLAAIWLRIKVSLKAWPFSY